MPTSNNLVNQPVTIEGQYVSRTVGPALAKGLAEIVEKRPADPVEYLAHFLRKYVQNQEMENQDRLNAELVAKCRIEKEIEERRKEEMRREVEAMREQEEKVKREKEAAERRKKEMEELAKRKEEVANTAPPLPSLAEVEDHVVEFGETKLHKQAATEGSNLKALLKENSLAARNDQYKTPRDVAKENNLEENVKQIDEYIWEMVAQEDYRNLTDLVVLGFDDLTAIIQAKYGDMNKMIEQGLKNQAEQIYNVFPQIKNKIKEIKENIEKNDLETLKVNLDKKYLAFFRDGHGKSAVHLAIEKKKFQIAIFLIEKYNVLSKLNDCFEKYPLDYLKAIDPATLNENDQALYEQLSDILNE